MAAANLISTGTGSASSIEIVVAAGDPVTVALKGIAGTGVLVAIEIKDDAGGWQQQDSLTDLGGERAKTIAGPGTYRLTRVSGTCGAFRA